jgi:hypothetical protein
MRMQIRIRESFWRWIRDGKNSIYYGRTLTWWLLSVAMFRCALMTMGKTQILRQRVVSAMTCHQGSPAHAPPSHRTNKITAQRDCLTRWIWLLMTCMVSSRPFFKFFSCSNDFIIQKSVFFAVNASLHWLVNVVGVYAVQFSFASSWSAGFFGTFLGLDQVQSTYLSRVPVPQCMSSRRN